MTKDSTDKREEETYYEQQRAVYAPYDWMARAKSKAVITKEVIEIPISNAIDFGDLPSYPRLEEIKEAARKLLREDQIYDANLSPQDPQFQSRMEALEEMMSFPQQEQSALLDQDLTDMGDDLVPVDGRSSL